MTGGTPRGDGRLVVLGALALYLALLAGAAVAGLPRPWRLLGVQQERIPFLDLHNVLSAIDCAAEGHDVLVSNPCDGMGRPMNYPRAWLLLGAAGVGGSALLPLGIAMGVAFFAAALGLLGKLDRRGGLVAAAALCSPSAMLLVERGNVDIVIFVLSAAAAWLAGRERVALAAVPLTAAAALKLFPVVGLPAALLVPGRARAKVVVGAAAAAAFAAYLYGIRDEVRAIAAVVPRGGSVSYGANVVAARLLAGAVDLRPVFVALCALAAVLGLRSSARAGAPDLDAGVRGHAFALGSLLYLGTFALGNSWAYRLSFLLLLLPQLAAWRAQGGAAARRGALLTAALLLSLWLVAEPLMGARRGVKSIVWVLGQAASWTLAVVLAHVDGALLARAARAWRSGPPVGRREPAPAGTRGGRGRPAQLRSCRGP